MNAYTLPLTFVLDALSRDLNIGTIISSNKKQAKVEASEEQINELLSDATYYAEEARFFGSDYRSICQSAKATATAIIKQKETNQ
jgi:hypothetical protein